MRRALIASTALLACAGLLGHARPRQSVLGPDAGATAYVCPMHPDYTLETAGTCPRCGMALVRSNPYDVRDYGLEFTTTPAPVRPGEPSRWRFRVFHPGSGDRIRSFEQVHERRYHLFVLSQDLEHFQHLHPEMQPDGTWTIDVTLPTAGYYKVLSDFVPGGGTAQFLARPLVTAGVAGDLGDQDARLVPDAVHTKVVDDITATVSYDPPAFVAGLYGHLTYTLRDTRTGLPVTDLQTYLGAFGHTLVVSDDAVDYVHSHPLDILASGGDDDVPRFVIPPGADLDRLRGGPEVTFDGLMPRPGRYRAFTQFRRHDRLYTFTATFEVIAP